MSTGVFLFRKDLRLTDQPLLAKAAAECDKLVLLVVLERTHWLDPSFYATRGSAKRQRFVYESIHDLELAIERRGGQLVIRFGVADEVLAQLFRALPFDRVYLEELPGTEEEREWQSVKIFCAAQDVDFFSTWQRTLIPLEGLPMHWSKIPSVFTTFRIAVEKHSAIEPAIGEIEWPQTVGLPSDEWPVHLFQQQPTDLRSGMHFKGGASAASERLRYYCSDTSLLGHYKETRNGMLGADYSSKLSPWLALGCISAVEVYAAVEEYEKIFGANSSTYWLKFELLWRDFFQFTAKSQGHKIFRRRGFAAQPIGFSKPLEAAFLRWSTGNTGQPFVDACIRELRATGFMSNRGRQNVASYLVHDLGEDWRKGARFFEYHLLDYDVASNWCNWAYIAGVGNDPRAGRKFNVEKQALDYDPDQKFRKVWSK